MITIYGMARNHGIAIAVAAKVDAIKGINGVSQAILQQGIDALQKQLEIRDYPEVIIACDDLTTGLAVKIPGIRVIGIAAQSDIDLPGLEIEVPCAVGLENLLNSINEGDILILDGNKGTVYMDPNPPTLVHYQQVEEQHEARSKIFISSEHIPARTQTGKTVSVLAYVTSDEDTEKGLTEGADGLFVDLRGTEQDAQSFYETVYIQAAGKTVWFAADYLSPGIARAAAKYALPDQTAVLLDTENYDELLEEAETVLESVGVEAFLDDLEPPKLRLGLIAREEEYAASNRTGDDTPLALATHQETIAEDLSDKLPQILGARQPEDVVLLVGDQIGVIPRLVEAGIRSIAVNPKLVSEAKFTIRSIGAGEE